VSTRIGSEPLAIQEASAFDLRCAVGEDLFNDCLWEGLSSTVTERLRSASTSQDGEFPDPIPDAMNHLINACGAGDFQLAVAYSSQKTDFLLRRQV
jgi:hypothetical protein